jgi:hypothetical protein
MNESGVLLLKLEIFEIITKKVLNYKQSIRKGKQLNSNENFKP